MASAINTFFSAKIQVDVYKWYEIQHEKSKVFSSRKEVEREREKSFHPGKRACGAFDGIILLRNSPEEL